MFGIKSATVAIISSHCVFCARLRARNRLATRAQSNSNERNVVVEPNLVVRARSQALEQRLIVYVCRDRYVQVQRPSTRAPPEAKISDSDICGGVRALRAAAQTRCRRLFAVLCQNALLRVYSSGQHASERASERDLTLLARLQSRLALHRPIAGQQVVQNRPPPESRQKRTHFSCAFALTNNKSARATHTRYSNKPVRPSWRRTTRNAPLE